MEWDDKRLVERATQGDGRAFEALVRKYQRRIYRLAYGMVRDPEEAMDLAQEAFVKAHRNLARFKGDSSFYTWLYRITKNLCIDHLRRRRGETVEYDDGIRREEVAGTPLGLDSRSKDTSPLRATLDRELAEKLEAALATLSEDHRAILLLREIEGLSYEALAETLEIKKGTVMSRLFHARKNMQKALRDYLSEEEYRALLGEKPVREETG
ncbi:MAG: sigma-70 family RNA polymerase sigma factor [Deltaproteobacteria bacterium]|nr:MAG: sigma-70 family RNA polymerase sigma factor [Deltaproteobacteria bacterium]